MSDFLGTNRTLIASHSFVSTHTHRIEIVEYTFADGAVHPYVEVFEAWPDGMAMGRRIAFSDAVHALLNLGDMELFQVGNRSPHHRVEGDVMAKSEAIEIRLSQNGGAK